MRTRNPPRMVEQAVLFASQEIDSRRLAFMPPGRASYGMRVVCYLSTLLHVLLAAIEPEQMPETALQNRLSVKVVGLPPHPHPMQLQIRHKHFFRNSQVAVPPGYVAVNAQVKVGWTHRRCSLKNGWLSGCTGSASRKTSWCLGTSP